ncbi:MAG: hypothetical protein ABEJ36_05305 [Candidatus Nanosalina sp.]
MKDDWKKIKEKFREHFEQRNIVIERERMEYSKSGEHLEIKRNGEISGAMPLHSNKMEKANRIQISNSEIKIISEDSKYSFRR